MTVPEVLAYLPLARGIARDFYWPGADREDVEQEATYWLVQAARSFDPARGASFATFARTVIRNRLLEEVRRERYRRPQFVELEAAEPAVDQLVETVVARERLRAVLAVHFSDLERVALGRAIRGEPCTEPKALDNALYRVRLKLGRRS